MGIYKDKNKTSDGRQYYFVVSYVGIDGKYKNYKSKRYLTKKEAQRGEADYLLKIGKKAPTDNMTFNEVIDRYLLEKSKTLKPQSYKRARTTCDHVRNTLGNISVSKMTRFQYEQFRQHLEDSGLSVIYMNKINTQLKTLIKYAYDNYDIRNDIPNKYPGFVDTTPTVKEMDFFTVDEFKAFYNAITDSLKYRAYFLTLFMCGLRMGEANCLQFKDLDFEKRTISITKTVSTKMRDKDGNYLITTPKTKASIRTLPMPESVFKALTEMFDYWSISDGFTTDWFVFGGLKPLPETSIQKARDKYCDIANLRHIRIHDFRHSCASMLINNGANITLVSKYLGHSDIEMTLNTYSHMYKSKLDELVETLDKILT